MKNVYCVIVVTFVLYLFVFSVNMVRAYDLSIDIIGEDTLNVELFTEKEIKEGIAGLGSVDLKIQADNEQQWRLFVEINRSVNSVDNMPAYFIADLKNYIELWSHYKGEWIGAGDWLEEGKGNKAINNIELRLNIKDYLSDNRVWESSIRPCSIKIDFHLKVEEITGDSAV